MFKRTCAVGAVCALVLAGFLAPAAAQQSADKAKQESKSLSKSDQRYFQELARSNLAEIQTGKLAQGKAASEEVKQYGQRMVADHTTMLEEQRTLARTKSVSLPAAPDDKHQQAFKRLESMSGAEFDRAFMEQMVKDHENALRLVKDIAAKADDPDLQALGKKAVPEIQKHLEKAQSLASSVKPGKAGASR